MEHCYGALPKVCFKSETAMKVMEKVEGHFGRLKMKGEEASEEAWAVVAIAVC